MGEDMNNILQWLEIAEDIRQEWKVKHLLKDVIALVFFASMAYADDWQAIYAFGKMNEKFLRKYLELPHGIPSHDTIQRVFSMVSKEYLQEFRKRWEQVMSGKQGERIKRILGIDGKTQRGNATANQKANHIVSAVDDRGFCVGEVLTHEKSNEIAAIPELLKTLNIKGNIITIDAMGCQTNIAALIRKKYADYVLALKGNQGTLYEDVKLYFSAPDLLAECDYTVTKELARGAIEKREYWQTDDIKWLPQLKEWAGLKTIAMTKNTITKNGITTVEYRYFISSLPQNAKEVAYAIRSHWMVESYHWHLDVTFHEDANRTAEKDAAYNLNIIRKMALNTLKLVDVSHIMKRASIKNKRYIICSNFEQWFETLVNL
jgi:predicted transposase YbfD/YdcC